jgi:hypothetical protein
MRSSGRIAALAGWVILSGCRGHGPVSPPALVVLRLGAQDLDVEIRLKALGCLIRSAPEPGAGTWTPRALWDPSPFVQRAALDALAGRMVEPETRLAVAGIAARSDADPYVRGFAGGILADSGERVASISEAWRQAGAPWQAAPLALAAARMGDPEAPAAVARALAEGEFPLEVTFFLAIGHSGLEDLVPSLEEAAATVEEDLVLPVAAALVGLGASTGEVLFRQALGGPEERRMEALDFLADLDLDVARDLVRGATEGDGPAARYARLVLVGWGEMPLEEAMAAATDPDREIRALAVRAIGRALGARPARAEGRAQPALADALGDPEPIVRLEAIRALGRVSRPGDRDRLRPFLAPEDGRVDLLAIEAARALVCPGSD